MARKVRVEYPGAIYHIMSRGDRREAIFGDDNDRWRFLETLAEACVKTGWQIHAYPQPGYVIAHPDVTDAGHCAIIDYDGGGIGAGVSGTVNKNFPSFYDGTARYRNYSP